MDTKSKKYKPSFGIKFAAFCVAFILAFSSAFLAVKAINNLYKYGFDILTKQASNLDATESSAFCEQLTGDLQSIYAGSGIMTWENYKRTYYSTFEEELGYARSELESFKKDAMSAAVAKYYDNNSSGYDNYSDNSTDSVTQVTGYGTSAAEVSPNYDKDYYNSHTESYSLSKGSSGSITLSTATTDEELTALVQNAYNQVMTAAKREYETTATTEGQNIKKITNLKYYICNSQTGAVITNLENTFDSVYTVKKDFSEKHWFMTYTTGGGLASSSPQVTSNTLYSTVDADKYFYNMSSDYFTKLNLSMVLGNCFSDNGYDVYLSLDDDMTPGDAYYNLQQGIVESSADTYRYIFASVAMLLVTAMLSVYLIYSAGRVVNGDEEEVRLTLIDKFPTDLHLAISVCLTCLGITGIFYLATYYAQYYGSYTTSEVLLLFAAMSGLAVCIWMVVLEWFCSVSKYYKARKNWLKASLIYLLCKWIAKPFKTAAKRLKSRPVTVRKKIMTLTVLYVIGNALLSLITMFCYSNQNNSTGFFFLMSIAAYNLIALSVIWKYILALDKIIVASQSTKEGKLPEKISGENIPEPLNTLATNLYFTQDEMQKAISEAVKGERMKTELITNVSHDLKTPLTSIISYVDLLKKCDIDEISAQKYITVLDEKSKRLKRLIEDLVEASKASSGAITFNKMNVNFYELAVQAIGEMSDGFENNNLEIVLDEPEAKPVIYADSQKTWRVIDNLLSNAKKYALEGSRIYIDIGTDSTFGTFTIKNISREPLNIDPEELTQRFVRGDESRTLEGSGLGLSIAKDLCTLQGGKLELSIDGDLFKATVKMPLVFDPEAAEPKNDTTTE